MYFSSKITCHGYSQKNVICAANIFTEFYMKIGVVRILSLIVKKTSYDKVRNGI
jgi:hypothetical protein